MITVKQDYISLSITIISIVVFLYAGLFSDAIMLKAVFVVMLAIAGIVLSLVTKTSGEVESDISESQTSQLVLYLAVSLGVIFFLNLTLPNIVPFAIVFTDPLPKKLFAVLIAVAEENFFRGFITPYTAGKTHSIILGSLASGAIFAIYHLAVYQSLNVILIVFGSGVILSYAALKTGRLSTTMIAHIVNNFLSA